RVTAANVEIVRRGQLPDAAIDRARIGHITERKELLDGFRIEAAIDLVAEQERFELGGEEQPAIGQKAVIERLLAEAVAGEEQRLAPGIPQSKGKLSIEPIETRRPPFLPGVDDHLGIAARSEHMAEDHEFGHQRLEIVDLAIVDNADRPIRVEERLIAGHEIDNRQAEVAEPQPRREMETVTVRSAMTEDIGHTPQQGPIDLAGSAIIEDTRYAAHLMIRFDKSKTSSRPRTLDYDIAGPGPAPSVACRSKIANHLFDLECTVKLQHTNGW